jgi:hypothetical protein
LFLGESDDFTHEKYGARTLLLRHLASRGFSALAEELPWADGIRIDRFLACGDVSELERVTTFGYRSAARESGAHTVGAALEEILSRFPAAAFRAEHTAWLRALRASRKDGAPWRYMSFDVDADPGAVEELLAEPRAPTHGAEALAASHRYVEAASRASDYTKLGVAMARREAWMVQTLGRIISELDAEDRLVILGHVLHLLRAPDAIELPPEVVGPDGGKAPAVGTTPAPPPERGAQGGLDARRPGRGLTPNRRQSPSTRAARDPESSPPQSALPRAPAARARTPGRRRASRRARRDLRVGLMSGTDPFEASARLPELADALLFLPRVTPLRQDV